MTTHVSDDSVETLLAGIGDPVQRADAERLVEMMAEISGEPAQLWGSIVGFGRYHYRYASRREGDAPLVGFAPRKRELSLYLTTEPDVRASLLAKLGPHRAGAACVYVKRLDALDLEVLREFITRTVEFTRTQDVSAT